LFYKAAYRLGVTPWEEASRDEATSAKISELFDREQEGREPPLGRALDLGCGSGIWAVELARRGWEVTGIDMVGKALTRANKRAREAGKDVGS
jgi:2-polyprenyl-3-methyl-5-hydroxy-6-metoxy-1,4-benzoquinol methylase